MRRYYLIDHKILFLFGYVFYLFTPYIVGTTNLFSGYPGMELYQGFFKLIPREKLVSYLWITISWLPAFFLGHFCFKLLKPYKKTLQLFPATPASYSLRYIGIALFIVLLIFIYLGRNSLFGGYSSYDVGARGKFSTLLVLFNFLLLYQMISQQKVSRILISGTFITALLLLTMGGRMYVFQTVIILLIYKTSFAPKRWKLYQIVSFIVVAFFLGGIAGVWRMGSSFSLDKAGYSFLAEPVFTWFSTSTFLTSNDIPVVNMPWNFLTSFLNLMPNSIISLKQFVISTQAMGYSSQSPLGADSVWSTYVINFGSVGSFFFVFITGFVLNFLRHMSEQGRFWAVYYILVCGMLPFQFFRDGFYIIHKQLFFNFLLFPALILLVVKTIIYLQNNVRSTEDDVRSTMYDVRQPDI
ncbi:MAG: hypothetical protein ABIR18_16175 [Chitinophagaceae bacterium]